MKFGIRKCLTCIAAALLLACGTSMTQADNCSGTDILVWQIVETTEPPARKAGIIVESVEQLVDKLKNEAGVI